MTRSLIMSEEEGGGSGSNNINSKRRTGRRRSRRRRGRRRNAVEDHEKLPRVEGKAEISCCSNCGFQSKRAFNVVRHYRRIHDPAKRQITCCGRTILSKGDYYQHCADNHPETRRSSIVSRTKYKIMKREYEYEYEENKPALRERKSGEKGVKKVEKIESRENFLQPKDENCVTIFIEGDPSSPIHAKILAEFLDNIDFESLKLP
ncbi:uncharacterized protein LOC124407943 [Diprion similis]|uniref:uncharacterized protein LOC124407943 n=1 Tax=Diprion similis TaxID=362088 RepID=UPI001EF8274F|nr:uncharacterized protein LOC124407943 [Diprion similis]